VSGIFDEEEGDQPAPTRRTPSRRPRALLPTLAIVVALVVLFSLFVELWTTKLWFSSVGPGFHRVFSTLLWTRVALFVVFGLILSAVVVGNIVIAYRTRPILIGDGYRNPTIERYQDTLEPIRHWVVVAIGVLMFIFGGSSGSGHWRTYLMWRHGVHWGANDVFFHRDIGFFVFGYPWYRYLLSFGFTTLVVGILAAAATHYVYGGVRLQARRDRVVAAAQVQLSLLLGVFMLLKSVSYWLDRYGLEIANGHLLTGITYTDAHAMLPAKQILAVIALICALLFFGNVIRPTWMLPVLGLGLLLLSAILVGGIWPAIVQRFQVKPSEPDKEAPYIAMNIAATRDAYDLNTVKVEQYPGVTTDTPKQLQAKADTLPGVRLIDPRLVAPAFEQLQQVRGFYKMPDVLDVDRYTLPGQTEPQDVVIAARELDLAGVPASQRNWNNDHTVYTHGYGVVAAFGDKRSPIGEPVWAEQDLPSVGDLGKFQQQVYFGESEPDYSIVGAPAGTPPVELNIPDTQTANTADQTSTYHGSGGVSIGSPFHRLLYAAKFFDSSILLSGRVNKDSKIIYDRDPRKMVEKVAPWLTVDGDPYPAVVDGRLLWIIDGYTTTNNYPQSESVGLSGATSDSLTSEEAVAGQQNNNINYIRNSVKATVDAYDGRVTLYQWDTKDPLLKTWMNAFPGVVHPRSEIDKVPGLLAHLRYPEDLFKVQRELLATYHVTDPQTFYKGSENWKVPEDPTFANANLAQPPFYLTVQLPDQKTGQFGLTSVYVPNERQNLASFITVDADASSKTYGQITVLELLSNNAVPGPNLVENAMSTDPNVSAELLKYKQDTTVQMGNLLTLPLDKELLYVQPVYTFRGGTGSYPILQFVIVSVGGGGENGQAQVGIGTSFDQAFANALGISSQTPTGTGNSGGGGLHHGGTGASDTVQQKLALYLSRAQQSLRNAQTALHAGDLATYQTDNDNGVKWLTKYVDLLNSTKAAPSTTNPTTTAPSSGAPPTSGSTGAPPTAPTAPTTGAGP
jgi:uncharacterized membrane protein (UPF0182 family)